MPDPPGRIVDRLDRISTHRSIAELVVDLERSMPGSQIHAHRTKAMPTVGERFAT